MTGLSASTLLLVYALAVARITRLVITDGIFERPRTALLDYLTDNRHPKLLELAGCPWCISVWVAAAVMPLAWFHGRNPWMLIPAAALASSYAVGWLASHETQPRDPR